MRSQNGKEHMYIFCFCTFENQVLYMLIFAKSFLCFENRLKEETNLYYMLTSSFTLANLYDTNLYS